MVSTIAPAPPNAFACIHAYYVFNFVIKKERIDKNFIVVCRLHSILKTTIAYVLGKLKDNERNPSFRSREKPRRVHKVFVLARIRFLISNVKRLSKKVNCQSTQLLAFNKRVYKCDQKTFPRWILCSKTRLML